MSGDLDEDDVELELEQFASALNNMSGSLWGRPFEASCSLSLEREDESSEQTQH